MRYIERRHLEVVYLVLTENQLVDVEVSEAGYRSLYWLRCMGM